MALPIYRYPLDATGENPNNRVVNEPHDLQPVQNITDVRVFAPIYGPFYANNLLEVRDRSNGRLLAKGTDYKCTDLLQDPTLKFAQEICQFVVITNGAVSNNISVTYQVLGGNYQNDATAIQHVFETFLNDTRPVDWSNISNKPATFPPSLHIHLLEDVVGWAPMIVALGNIEQAITMSCTPMFEALIDYVKDRTTDISEAITTPTGVSPGTYGSSRRIPSIEVNLLGQVVKAQEMPIRVDWSEIVDKPEWLNQYSAKVDTRIVFSNMGDIYFNRGPALSIAIGGDGNSYVQSGTPSMYVGDPSVLNFYSPVGIHFEAARFRFGFPGGSGSVTMTNNVVDVNGSITLSGREPGLAYDERVIRFPGGMYLYGNTDTPGARIGFHNGSQAQGGGANSFFLNQNGDVVWNGRAYGDGRGITNIQWGNIAGKAIYWDDILNKPNVDSATKLYSYSGGEWGFVRAWTDGWAPPQGVAKVFIQWTRTPMVDDEMATSITWPITFSGIYTCWVTTLSEGPNPVVADYILQLRGWDNNGAQLFAQGTYGGGRGGVRGIVYGIGLLN